MLPRIWVAGINKCIFFLSETIFPEQMMLDGSMISFFFFFPTLPPGSVISEVIMVLYLRFRFHGKRMFLAQHGASCLTVPWKFYPLERELFPACVLLPPAGEWVPGRQSQQMSSAASLFSLLFISLPDHLIRH